MYATDNPMRDYDRWEARILERRKDRPICDGCGEPIMEDTMLVYRHLKYHADSINYTNCLFDFALQVYSEYMEAV